MKRPIDFAIVGAHKCATTSLYHFLRQHVDIYLPEIEENRFFTKPEFYAEGDRFLDPLYQGHRNSQRLGMKNVHIMFFRYSVDRLHKDSPACQLIVVLRNPIDRAYSAYWFARFNGWENAPTFEEALALEPQRLEGSYDEQTELTYLHHGHYAEQLRHCFERFDRDRVLVLLTDEIKANAAAAVRHTLAWLGIDPNGHTLDVSRRRMTAATPKSARLQKFLMARDTVYRRAARKMIPQRVRIALQRRVVEPLLKSNIKPFTYPPMEPQTRESLQSYFRSHNRKLEELLGVDLSHWK